MQDEDVVEHRGTGTGGSAAASAPGPGTMALARTGPVRWASVLAALGLVHLVVVTAIGAAHQGLEDFGTQVVSTGLYTLSGLGSGGLLTLALLIQVAATRRRRVPRWTIEVLVVGAPVSASALLAAAYVSRLGGGHFIGGGSAMVALTVSLVLLARRAAGRS